MSFLFHDDCMECDGKGYIVRLTPLLDDVQIKKEQCDHCKLLIKKDEIEADRKACAGDDLIQIRKDRKLLGEF